MVGTASPPAVQPTQTAAVAAPAAIQPSLLELERSVARRDYATALTHTLLILNALDRTMGLLDGVDIGLAPPGLEQRDIYQRFATRFAAAFSELIVNGGEAIAPMSSEVLFSHHRWIDNIFAISGFQSTDHLAVHFGGGGGGQWRLNAENLSTFLMLFNPSSTMDVNFEECIAVNRPATVVALIAYLSARICVEPRACAFREKMLQWLPGRFAEVTLGTVPLQKMTEPFTHCSYAMDVGKHRIKADLMAQMRHGCLASGCPEYDPAKPRKARKKPRIVIVTEHYSVGHAIFRTHSRAVRSLREKFEVIGVCHGDPQEPDVLSCFDDIIRFPMEDLMTVTRKTAEAILEREPDIVFHLGVGLTVTAISLASLRLAPIQCVSYGHTATTMSPTVDYMVLPEDFVTTPTPYSEKLVLLPWAAFPYTPRIINANVKPKTALPGKDEVLRIAVPASVMKINSFLLAALGQIAAAAKRPIEFHFFPLGARGVAYFYLEREIKKQLANAVVHMEAPHDTYLERLSDCAFFLCPFPYGNMNSIVDCLSLGLPGVCLDGPEAHAHADVAFFKRLGLPDELAAGTIEQYVANAAKLINDPAWLAKCRKAAAKSDLDVLFQGDETEFCKAIYALVKPAK
jgi:HMW1C N-terminal/HMW1 domain 2